VNGDAPAGAAFVTGDRYPELRSSLLIATLSSRRLLQVVFRPGKPKEVLRTELLIENTFRTAARRGPGSGRLYLPAIETAAGGPDPRTIESYGWCAWNPRGNEAKEAGMKGFLRLWRQLRLRRADWAKNAIGSDKPAYRTLASDLAPGDRFRELPVSAASFRTGFLPWCAEHGQSLPILLMTLGFQSPAPHCQPPHTMAQPC
jgi:hypothetical protein